MNAILSTNKGIKKVNNVFFSQKTFWIIISCIIIMVLTYIYFINTIVWHVAMRQQTERKLSDMTAKISDLESQYVGLTSNINIENAYALGFTDTPSNKTQFIKRSSTLGSLQMRQVQ